MVDDSLDKEVQRLIKEEVRKALHDAWLAVHVRRFDKDYASSGQTPPDYAEQKTPDVIYKGILMAEQEITKVASNYGITYHAVRDMRYPVEIDMIEYGDE